MGFIGDSIDSLKSINVRQALEQAITLASHLLSSFFPKAWSRHSRGMGEDPIRAGEIVVFNIDRREIPIVHRVIKVFTLRWIRYNHHDGHPDYKVCSYWSFGFTCNYIQRLITLSPSDLVIYTFLSTNKIQMIVGEKLMYFYFFLWPFMMCSLAHSLLFVGNLC
ncbi:hypothetical protein Ccrd_015635 [Cynara cardunculus var. scolymus]|uniref:Signal peptidase I n=1 Tax=Cynara cardunculus var. scolymus TaxID=59895 RepID=A0A103YBG6_CYNCS|nr:hypothetical protein Ccrd_015635 [Cynara cardunculus var. scolymus]